ncbi:Hypothetical predicted protein [Octopus vulgaris]|uniref:Uncharacterized protein n=1 Tax=Octopus vulgaris TaxID=6645 RepID=A0AA36EYD5_OCTVU|nr:Hypothetical predicted protein [Octopus vulgaris]
MVKIVSLIYAVLLVGLLETCIARSEIVYEDNLSRAGGLRDAFSLEKRSAVFSNREKRLVRRPKYRPSTTRSPCYGILIVKLSKCLAETLQGNAISTSTDLIYPNNSRLK